MLGGVLGQDFEALRVPVGEVGGVEQPLLTQHKLHLLISAVDPVVAGRTKGEPLCRVDTCLGIQDQDLVDI